MNIVILGPPGSGKGTQSEFLTNNFQLKHFSTGELLRYEVQNQTELGKIAQGFMNQGLYVPDQVMNNIVAQELKRNHQQIIFDGYPRTIEQAQFLDHSLRAYQCKIDLVIYLKIDEATLIERLLQRLVCPVCNKTYNKSLLPPKVDNICDLDQTPLVIRVDDSDQTKIKTRMSTYHEATVPLLDYYQKAGIVQIVDANQTTSIIHQTLHNLLEQHDDNN